MVRSGWTQWPSAKSTLCRALCKNYMYVFLVMFSLVEVYINYYEKGIRVFLLASNKIEIKKKCNGVKIFVYKLTSPISFFVLVSPFMLLCAFVRPFVTFSTHLPVDAYRRAFLCPFVTSLFLTQKACIVFYFFSRLYYRRVSKGMAVHHTSPWP